MGLRELGEELHGERLACLDVAEDALSRLARRTIRIRPPEQPGGAVPQRVQRIDEGKVEGICIPESPLVGEQAQEER